MDMFNLVLLMLIKPLILTTLGMLQYRALSRFSATVRHLNVVLVVLLIPASVLIGLVWVPPLVLPIISHSWVLSRVELFTLAGGYIFISLWFVIHCGLGLLALNRLQQAPTFPEEAQLQQELNELINLVGLTRSVRLLLTETSTEPASWGCFRPVVQLPSEALSWTKTQRHFVMLHELGHIARHDWLWLMLVKAVVAVFWFLPPVWWLESKVTYMAEQASDDWVLTLDGRSADYADFLLTLEQQLNRNDLPVTPLLQRSNFSRIKALLEANSDHDTVATFEWRSSVFMGVVAVGMLSLVGWSPRIYPSYEPQTRDVILQDHAAPQHRVDAMMTALLPSEHNLYRPTMAHVALTPETPRLESIHVQRWRADLPSESNAELFNYQAAPLIQPSVRIKGYLPVAMVMPRYPQRALKRHIEGRVMMQFSINTQGQPEEITVVYAQPKGYFESSVKTALLASRFIPPSINGQRVKLQGVSEEFIFQLIDDTDAESPDSGSTTPTNDRPNEKPPPTKVRPNAITQIVFNH